MSTYSEWKKTPWWARWLGKYWRSVYAPWQIGGGWDGFEFSNETDEAT
jgi:hypothetical protein